MSAKIWLDWDSLVAFGSEERAVSVFWVYPVWAIWHWSCRWLLWPELSILCKILLYGTLCTAVLNPCVPTFPILSLFDEISEASDVTDSSLSSDELIIYEDTASGPYSSWKDILPELESDFSTTLKGCRLGRSASEFSVISISITLTFTSFPGFDIAARIPS